MGRQVKRVSELTAEELVAAIKAYAATESDGWEVSDSQAAVESMDQDYSEPGMAAHDHWAKRTGLDDFSVTMDLSYCQGGGSGVLGWIRGGNVKAVARAARLTRRQTTQLAKHIERNGSIEVESSNDGGSSGISDEAFYHWPGNYDEGWAIRDTLRAWVRTLNRELTAEAYREYEHQSAYFRDSRIEEFMERRGWIHVGAMLDKNLNDDTDAWLLHEGDPVVQAELAGRERAALGRAIRRPAPNKERAAVRL